MATATAKESRQLVTLAVVGCGERGKLSQNLARTRLSHSPRRTNSTVHSCSTIDRTFTASAKTIETPGRRLVDAVIVTVQHNMHRDVVLAFAAQGYRILCEKPLATTARDCFDMEVFVCFRPAIDEAGRKRCRRRCHQRNQHQNPHQRRLVPIQLTSDEDRVGGKSLPLPAQTSSTGDEVEKPESDGFRRSGTMRVIRRRRTLIMPAQITNSDTRPGADRGTVSRAVK
ncbi:hypothetical protein M404DRAFT_942663 [Pisolithus tinctorius Marx 270]|uniref:Gfo/Idh/MocA-like oxidoreductase N-terminal domain-containing protein n=1 Tax=Pisolithus tinctorius Marx 270 TaxID=870435 RepID=A0A0C3PFX3_PISTI|nr:hypothetical protein M404DRAFT_942663 [Pisolithus tinctorius Marx 270]